MNDALNNNILHTKKGWNIPNWEIRSCKSKKGRKYNSQNKKEKMTNNDLQNTKQKTKD